MNAWTQHSVVDGLPKFEVAYFDFTDDSVDDVPLVIEDQDWFGSGGDTVLVLIATIRSYAVQRKSPIIQKRNLMSSGEVPDWHDLVIN
ncbi:MAG: hypothetical protein HRT77_10115 [Halioglobus sp.]|nr:hypothetical protein [Halioglobus sp.]